MRVYHRFIHGYGLSAPTHRANTHPLMEQRRTHSTDTHPTGDQAALHYCYRSVQERRFYGRDLPLSAAIAPTTGWLHKCEPITRTRRVHRFVHLSAWQCIAQRNWPLPPLACLVQSRGCVLPCQQTSQYVHNLPSHTVSFCQRGTAAGVWCLTVGKFPLLCNPVEPPLAVGTI